MYHTILTIMLHTYIYFQASAKARHLSIAPDILDFMQERLPMTLLPALDSVNHQRLSLNDPAV